MNLTSVINIVGILLMLLAGIMFAPLTVAWIFQQPGIEGHLNEIQAFSITFFISLATGCTLWKLFPSDLEHLRDREGFAIVSFSWVSISLMGSLPFYLTGVCPSFIDALFESTSGFTTTGASILRDIDPLPKGILFWRNLSQWLGGMGIIMLSLAIFPALGIGSYHLFKAEVPGGAAVERMQPRLAETAKILWKVYLALTIIQIILMRLGGVGWFDALCNTFSTVATGGFSPHTASIGSFGSAYIESIVILFMFLGGINFALHFQMIQGNWKDIFNNAELRFYVAMVLGGVLFATWGLWYEQPGAGVATAFRRASFNVVSINTTTGFVTDDFNAWPNHLRLFVLGIMMVGGCVGSTSGSFKAIRVLVVFKIFVRELQKRVQPRGVFHVKVGQKTLDHNQVLNVVGLAGLFMGIFFLSAIFLTLLGVDPVTSVSASIASLFNIGPGLGQVGATGNYADIPGLGKCVIIFCMLMGRLEIYGIMALFLPFTWRK